MPTALQRLRRGLGSMALVLLLSAPAAAGASTRVTVLRVQPTQTGLDLWVTVRSEEDVPVADLSTDHVSLMVSGSTFEVVSAEQRPEDTGVALSLLVDASKMTGDYIVGTRELAAEIVNGVLLAEGRGHDVLRIVPFDQEPRQPDRVWTRDPGLLGPWVQQLAPGNTTKRRQFHALKQEIVALDQAAGLPPLRAIVVIGPGLDTDHGREKDLVTAAAKLSHIPIFGAWYSTGSTSDRNRDRMEEVSAATGGTVRTIRVEKGLDGKDAASSLGDDIGRAIEAASGVWRVRGVPLSVLEAGILTGQVTVMGTAAELNFTLLAPVSPSASAVEGAGPEVSSPVPPSDTPEATGPSVGALVAIAAGLVLALGLIGFVALRSRKGTGRSSERAERVRSDGPTTAQTPGLGGPSRAPVPPPGPAPGPPPGPKAGSPRWLASEATDKGPLDVNDDFAASGRHPDDPALHFACVADGLGGPGADRAAQIAVDAAMRLFRSHGMKATPQQLLKQIGLEAHRAVLELIRTNPTFKGAGTTLLVVLARGDRVFYGHVGHSRLYVLDSQGYRAVTQDHTVARLLSDQGQITPEAARTDPRRETLSQAIGRGKTIEIEVAGPAKALPGSRLVLCTDGLYRCVPDQVAAQVLRQAPAASAAMSLVREAVQRKTDDNVAVCVLASPG